jgi:hypothetical protein
MTRFLVCKGESVGSVAARAQELWDRIDEAKRHLRYPAEFRESEGKPEDDAGALRGCIACALDALDGHPERGLPGDELQRESGR